VQAGPENDNEAANIASILERTPEMGAGAEIIFVEGYSSDGTYEAIEREIAANRAYCGDFDSFGDVDLLFGDARLDLKIAELPIRYPERTYGATNIQRWRHGWMLLRTVAFAALRLKFV
jgi:hypothetical protein